MSLYHVDIHVDGEDKATNTRHDRIGPITEAPVTDSASASVSDVDDACEAAAQAFKSWSKTGPNHRREILIKAADILMSKIAEFDEIVMKETGAAKGWGAFNCKFGTDLLREAAAMTTRILGETIPADRPGTLSMAVRKPVGVLAGIAPWNAPVILGVRAIAMPLACGNTVVLKGSEACPKTYRLIVDSFLEAGLPKGVLNFITNAPEDGPAIVEALVTNKHVKRINFTGSTKVGRIIASLAAKDMKPVLLELGGKSPLVVLDDANIDAAVNAAIFGAFMHQGQICMSTERIIVSEKIAGEFCEKFVARAKKLNTGAPDGEKTQIAGVVAYRTIEHVSDLVNDAEGKGASIPLKGKSDGVVMSPNIVVGVTPEMRIWEEESFGPIVCVALARDDDHAIELANDTEYGLSAAVFASDISRAMYVADNIESGICHINGPTVFDEAQMPFGGVKGSGYGRFGGTFGVDEFTEVRWLTINTQEPHYPI